MSTATELFSTKLNLTCLEKWIFRSLFKFSVMTPPHLVCKAKALLFLHLFYFQLQVRLKWPRTKPSLRAFGSCWKFPGSILRLWFTSLGCFACLAFLFLKQSISDFNVRNIQYWLWKEYFLSSWGLTKGIVFSFSKTIIPCLGTDSFGGQATAPFEWINPLSKALQGFWEKPQNWEGAKSILNLVPIQLGYGFWKQCSWTASRPTKKHRESGTKLSLHCFWFQQLTVIKILSLPSEEAVIF